MHGFEVFCKSFEAAYIGFNDNMTQSKKFMIQGESFAFRRRGKTRIEQEKLNQKVESNSILTTISPFQIKQTGGKCLSPRTKVAKSTMLSSKGPLRQRAICQCCNQITGLA